MITGNAIASLVHRLRLERNIIVLKLTNLYAEDSEDEEQEEGTIIPSSSGHTNSSKSRMVEVEVDLGMTAYANVSRMYGHKKVAQAKEIKTVQVQRVIFRRTPHLTAFSHSTYGPYHFLHFFLEVLIDTLLLYCTALHCTALRLQASQRALIAVEQQSAKTLEAQKIKRNLQAVRKV
jgi:hypothetical protein